MKKTLQIAALLLAGYGAAAQDFAYKIPRNAQAVATLKSGHLFDLLSVQEFNQSFIGQKMLKGLSASGSKPYTSIRDLGISLNANVYYYSRVTDSITYHCVLLPLADAQKLERFVISKNSNSAIEHSGNLNKLVLSKSGKSMMLWNEGLALIIMAQPKRAFFETEQNSARYGIEPLRNEEETAATVEVAVDTAYAVIDAAPMIEMEASKPPPSKKKGKRSTGKNHKHPAVAAVEEIAVVEEPVYFRQDPKDSLAMVWMEAYGERVFRKSEDSYSILDNEGYRKSLDKNAAASFYVANLQDLYSNMPGSSYGTSYLTRLMRGYRNINAKLYLDDHTARITTDLELSDGKASMYRNIYNHPMNPDFLKYVNMDRVIGFMGYSLDTKAYLNEMPKLLQQTYGSYMTRYGGKSYKEEMDLGAELFSLLLDEEAVSKVVKGDALFLFNGVSSKTVTYKTYDYNDNYERKEVEKTKTETLPDFLLMVSSDDTRLIRKMLNYGMDKGEVTMRDGIYSLSGKSMKSPMVIHVLIKDGIIFLGTSMRDMQDIRYDRYEAHINKAQKNLILDNTMSAYFNPRKLEGKIPQKEIGSYRKWTELNTFLGNTGLLYAHTNGIEGKTISGEMVAEVPEGEGNALQYFFHLIDEVASKD